MAKTRIPTDPIPHAGNTVEPVTLDDDDTPTAAPPATPAGSADDRVAKLEAQLADLTARLAAQPGGLAIPAGYVLVPDQGETSAQRLAAMQADIERGVQARSQDVANDMWPHGRFVWVCDLPDRNGHPQLNIKADNATDARGRYLKAIGVTSTETEVQVRKA